MTWRDPIFFPLPTHNRYERKKVIEWVHENLEGVNNRGSKRYRWAYYKQRRRTNNSWGGYPKTRTVRTLTGIQIADKEDAIAFKLRWEN